MSIDEQKLRLLRQKLADINTTFDTCRQKLYDKEARLQRALQVQTEPLMAEIWMIEDRLGIKSLEYRGPTPGDHW